MKANKKFKDTLFRHLFNTEEKLLELFNAIFGTDYKDIGAIIINTLENVLFNGMKNDISFIIYNTLVLLEHQSTISANMPLRMYHYLNYLYEKINSDKPNAIYGRNLVELPNPVFIILYNGTEDYPAEKILNISTGLKKGVLDKKFVYLEVMVININKGRNPELERRCKTLADYASLIEKVREYQKNHTLEEAIRLAVKYCINNDILKEYLEQHASEVANMLTTEFSMDDALKVARWEGKKDGIEEGIEKGIEEGIQKGRQEGKLEIIDLLKSGKSPEEILKDYDKIQ
ncbi:MAG: Rpn family recombination-promoting nuclease/putative transposase [Leptospirales bacterium]|nr:Rpn family recombination-promoting nuclease/putative transposase [Leptospirales bacterium]